VSHLEDARARQLAVYRAMTPAQRWAEAVRLTDSMRELKRAYLSARHPAWTEDEVRQAVKRAFMYVRD
jgi:hypothetical protein